MNEYFPKPKSWKCLSFLKESDLSNATKADFKKATGVDTSEFAKNTDSANLKSDFDELNVGKLTTIPVDLSKLGSVVNNDIVKKTEYNKLVTKVNAIDASGFVFKNSM